MRPDIGLARTGRLAMIVTAIAAIGEALRAHRSDHAGWADARVLWEGVIDCTAALPKALAAEKGEVEW